MDRNVRDKLYKKKFTMPSRKEEYNYNSFPSYMYIWMPFFAKINVP